MLLSENWGEEQTGGRHGWHNGIESIQTLPSSSYFSGDKFNIALGSWDDWERERGGE
jgi:hypothetical protein